MAMIVEAFVGNCVDKLVTLASEEVVMVLGVKDELQRLQELLTTIHICLEAAERRRFQDKQIDHWVGKLKDVAYDADDIIDLFIIKGALLLPYPPSPAIKTLAGFYFSRLFFWFTSIPLRHQIAKRIRSLNGKLKEINEDRQQFHLEERRENQVSQTVVDIRQTSPLVELDIVGSEIEKATKDLVKMIAEERPNKCRIFAITGMGGIGKTTLAQKIYNNKMIQTDFQIKSWVCVSQSYKEIELLQRVIRGAEGDYGKATTKAELEPLLQSALQGKSLFLVLDDVWSADVWISLLGNPLLSGATIVRILVTTRDENVAMEMGVPLEHIRPVKQLSDHTSWELLRRSISVEGRKNEIEKLKDLGNQIVKKCSGLPLAVKAIAGILKKKGTNRKEWEKVLKNEAWFMSNLPEVLRGALYLSYDDLPSHLKQCFVYFSLFPEYKWFQCKELVRFWMAEGFVKEQSDTLLEDVAKEYCNELIRRNLLQLDPTNPTRCTMHDLLRSLAKFLSQDEIFFGEILAGVTSTSSRLKLRRLSFKNQKSLSDVEGLIVEQKCLRTLVNSHGIKVLNDNQLTGLTCLRFLLINDADIETIPNSIGDLIHLRYLDFDRTRIKELPESIGSLTNLQFLNLCGCCFLTSLPKSITKLQNLRNLGLIQTPLNSLPKGISKLKKINDLRGFVVADPRELADSCNSLEELNSLDQIRNLSISKMERAEIGSLSLQKLTRLVELELHYTKEKDRPLPKKEDIICIEDVLEELCPPQCLEDLRIFNFFGRHYPSWMKSPSFGQRLPHLTTLDLINHISCPQLPPVGELQQLSALSIIGAVLVKSIGPEFLGTSTGTAFSNLRLLSLCKMPELEEWTFTKENDGFEREERGNAQLLPHMDQLLIIDCPKLKALPQELEQSKIKTLHIEQAHSLRAVGNLPNVWEQLVIINNQSLERVSHLPSLQVLIIDNCPSLKCVEKLDSLQQLGLRDVVMDAVLKWLARLLQERKPTDDDDFYFQFLCNERVLQRLLKGGPDWPIIERIPRVVVSDNEESGFLEYTKNPVNYETELILEYMRNPFYYKRDISSCGSSSSKGGSPQLLLFIAALTIIAVGKLFW